MNDTTTPYKDNIKSHITRVYTTNEHSKAKNKDYSRIVIVFNQPNGKTYQFATFLTPEQKALIDMSVPLEAIL